MLISIEQFPHNRGTPIDSDPIAGQQPTATPQAPVASPLHTAALLLFMSGFSVFSFFVAGRMRAVEQPSRVPLYLMTFVFEWLVTGYIVLGVRSHHTPILEVMGARWQSARSVLRDIGIALAFWGVALVILSLVSHLVGMKPNVQFLAPQSPVEIVLWIALSVTAGICEETIFRGYLQKQFIAWTRNVPVGILLSAAFFGLGHIYQGVRSTVVITVYGLLFGILAQWRSSMRPGMIAHALQDTVGGLALRFMHK